MGDVLGCVGCVDCAGASFCAMCKKCACEFLQRQHFFFEIGACVVCCRPIVLRYLVRVGCAEDVVDLSMYRIVCDFLSSGSRQRHYLRY
jgi:hypothetical protein